MSDQTPLARVKLLLDTPEPPALGPGPRAGVEALNAITRRLESALKSMTGDVASPDLIKAVVLLWHDHLDASHEISQGEEGVDGSYVHGIMHRREPDFGNAKYWFRRVGSHACFPELAKRAEALLGEQAPKEWRARLLPRGRWDPFAMVDLCQELDGSPNTDARVRLLRSIQSAELELLLDRFCAERTRLD